MFWLHFSQNAFVLLTGIKNKNIYKFLHIHVLQNHITNTGTTFIKVQILEIQIILKCLRARQLKTKKQDSKSQPRSPMSVGG